MEGKGSGAPEVGRDDHRAGELSPAEIRVLDAIDEEALRKLEVEERALLERLERVEALEADLARLRGANIVVSMLYWNTGFALDAASGVSRFLDDWLTRSRADYTRHLTRPNPPGPPLWFQPAGDTRGQAWTGVFRDADKNGVMEFAPPTEDFRPGRWSRELNFLTAPRPGYFGR